jgi:hypothetical protein
MSNGQGPDQAGGGQPLVPEPPRQDKRLYFVLMTICVGLFVLSWAVIRLYSVIAAVVMSAVALLIPPFAAIVANVASATHRRRP